MITDQSTIKEAKDFLNTNFEDGVKCPCCKQTVKKYRLKLLAQTAVLLIEMYNLNKEWVHIMRELKPVNGYYAKLRFWGLIEERGDIPEGDVKASGYWKLTDKGKAFVEGSYKVSKYIYVFNNKYFGYDGEFIDIYQALGNKFSYSELMGRLI